jgi:cell division protein FtsB
VPVRGLKLLAVLLAVLFAWLQYRLWFGEGGVLAVRTLEARVEAQTRENLGLRERNAQLAAEVENLKSGEAAVEERARSELGMIKPGEVFHRVVEQDAAPPPATDADDGGDGAE